MYLVSKYNRLKCLPRSSQMIFERYKLEREHPAVPNSSYRRIPYTTQQTGCRLKKKLAVVS